jgi:hypothetical protein
MLAVMMLGGAVFAATTPTHPPGVFDLNVVTMAEYSVQQDAVTLPSVLVQAIPVLAQADQYNVDSVIQIVIPQQITFTLSREGITEGIILPMLRGYSRPPTAGVEYFIRC